MINNTTNKKTIYISWLRVVGSQWLTSDLRSDQITGKSYNLLFMNYLSFPTVITRYINLLICAFKKKLFYIITHCFFHIWHKLYNKSFENASIHQYRYICTDNSYCQLFLKKNHLSTYQIVTISQEVTICQVVTKCQNADIQIENVKCISLYKVQSWHEEEQTT